METVQQSELFIDKKELLPLAEINKLTHPDNKISADLNKVIIENYFPEQEYLDKNIKLTKSILGDLANKFSEYELKDLVAQVQYLTESWLDDFERELFDGKTLNEFLHEKGTI